MNNGCCKFLKTIISKQLIFTLDTRTGRWREPLPQTSSKGQFFVTHHTELNFAPLGKRGPRSAEGQERGTRLPGAPSAEAPAESPRTAVHVRRRRPRPGLGGTRARQPPCLPSRGLARKTLGPAPRLPNSSNALERPPFVLHSSNQVPAAHRPSAGLTRGATAHLYANYFATWTKVIMPSDRKLTGLKSRMEINKLTPLNGREPARAPRPHLPHLR